MFELPIFNYNPDLFWDAEPGHAKARIAAGPNNPVGLVWIQIDKEHFGLHGTPEPSQIGRTQSHGCVRMTNWDVVRLASLVEEGTPVTSAMTAVRRRQSLTGRAAPWVLAAASSSPRRCASYHRSAAGESALATRSLPLRSG